MGRHGDLPLREFDSQDFIRYKSETQYQNLAQATHTHTHTHTSHSEARFNPKPKIQNQKLALSIHIILCYYTSRRSNYGTTKAQRNSHY